MLRTFTFALMVVAAVTVGSAQETLVRSTVTYLAGGVVYVGVGRAHGVTDSSRARIVRGAETIATLQCTALSSRSSSWTGDSTSLGVRVGDSVLIVVQAIAGPGAPPADTTRRPQERTLLTTEYRPSLRVTSPPPRVDVSGRLGFQFFGTAFDEASLNIAQPGVIVAVRAAARDVPLRVDLYANLREQSRGPTPLFSARSSAASRLYRLTIEYDDKSNIVTGGRMAVAVAPTIGILDGLTYARRFGDLTAGVGVGLQPAADLQATDPTRKKVLAFLLYRPPGWTSASASFAYAKTWHRSASEREVVSAGVGASLSDRLSLWATSDVDLRVTQGGVHRMDPSLSLLLCTASWRVSDMFSVSGGLDASRSVLPYSFARQIPDSMTDKTLRGGLNLSGSFFPGQGMNVTLTLAPRMTAGSFNDEYTASSAVGVVNAFGSGLGLRVQGILSESRMTLGRGYSATVSGNAFTVDWNARFQQFRYRLKQVGPASTGSTVGFDGMVPISRSLTLIVSVDLVQGYGSAARSIFSELSYRF